MTKIRGIALHHATTAHWSIVCITVVSAAAATTSAPALETVVQHRGRGVITADSPTDATPRLCQSKLGQ